MVTAKNADTTVSRNSSFFEKLTRAVPDDENETIDIPPVTEHADEFPSPSCDERVPHFTPPTLENPVDDKDPKSLELKTAEEPAVPVLPDVPKAVPEMINEPPALRRSMRRRIPKKIFNI